MTSEMLISQIQKKIQTRKVSVIETFNTHKRTHIHSLHKQETET